MICAIIGCNNKLYGFEEYGGNDLCSGHRMQRIMEEKKKKRMEKAKFMSDKDRKEFLTPEELKEFTVPKKRRRENIMVNEIKILDWTFDKNDIWLMRIVTVLFTTIAVGLVLYYQLIPFGPHNEVLVLSMIVGSIPGIAIIKVIHKLRTRRIKPHVK